MPTDTQSPIRFAEFFAGIGLVRMGLEAASKDFECVFANDLDETKQAMYAYHFGLTDHIDGSDVHKLSGESIPDIELATASFPCTDLSLAGGRAGIHKGESSAFWGFHRVLKEMGDRKPQMVLLENVTGLLTSNKGKDFRAVLQAMNELGYAVDPFILDARWFVPQSRVRLFVVCTQQDLVPGDTFPTIETSRIRPQSLIDFIESNRDSIAWSIRDLPEPPKSSRKSLADIVVDPSDDNEDWWSEDRVEYLLDQMFDRHLSWVDKHREDNEYHYATAFRRVRPIGDGTKRSMAELRTDGIAGCLRTPKGGSGRQILVRAGKGTVKARLLSPRECAALMGAPRFRLSGTVNQSLFGFGDAVCVNAIRWIATHYLGAKLSEATQELCGYAAGSNGLAEVST